MGKTFEVGDHVSWNSEAGRARGKIVKVHIRDVSACASTGIYGAKEGGRHLDSGWGDRAERQSVKLE
jgi:hypothetical protein